PDGNTLAAVKITTLPGAGSLSYNHDTVSDGPSFPLSSIALFKPKFAPAADANGAGYASFTFQVQDNGGTANGGVDLDPIANTIRSEERRVGETAYSADDAGTVMEDGTYVFSAADFGFNDHGDVHS